ncbi:hypothetical protein MAR_018164, partial [Mya arenaria]
MEGNNGELTTDMEGNNGELTTDMEGNNGELTTDMEGNNGELTTDMEVNNGELTTGMEVNNGELTTDMEGNNGELTTDMEGNNGELTTDMEVNNGELMEGNNGELTTDNEGNIEKRTTNFKENMIKLCKYWMSAIRVISDSLFKCMVFGVMFLVVSGQAAAENLCLVSVCNGCSMVAKVLRKDKNDIINVEVNSENVASCSLLHKTPEISGEKNKELYDIYITPSGWCVFTIYNFTGTILDVTISSTSGLTEAFIE